MRIAVIGAGNMGRALAGSLVRAGHEVSIAFGRDEAKVAAAARETAARLPHHVLPSLMPRSSC